MIKTDSAVAAAARSRGPEGTPPPLLAPPPPPLREIRAVPLFEYSGHVRRLRW